MNTGFRAAAAASIVAVVLPLTAAASEASPGGQAAIASGVPAADHGPVSARPSIKSLQGAVKKAKKRVGRTRKQVAGRTADLQAAQQAAAAAQVEHARGVQAVEWARQNHEAARAELEAARAVIASEPSVRADLAARRAVAAPALAEAESLLASAVTRRDAAATDLAQLEAKHADAVVKVPQMRQAIEQLPGQIQTLNDRLAEAWAREEAAWLAYAAVAGEFEAERAKRFECQLMANGTGVESWHCRTSASAPWLPDATLDALWVVPGPKQRHHRAMQLERWDIELEIQAKTKELETAQAELPIHEEALATLPGRIPVARNARDAAQREVDQHLNVRDQKASVLAAVDADTAALDTEIARLKAAEPALAAIQHARALSLDENYRASERLLAAQSVAGEAHTDAEAALATARALHSKARAKLKKVTKRLKRARRSR